MNKILTVISAAVVFVPAYAPAQRTPISIAPLTKIEHEATPPGVRYDSSTRTMARYPVNGRIEMLSSSGDFLVSWSGADGRRRQLRWEPPSKLSAIVEAEVALDEQTGIYTYSYRISNAVASSQRLRSFYIEAHGVSESSKPDASWYSRALTPFLSTALGVQGWGWSQVFGSDGIPAGQTAIGFRVMSRRPPGIVKVYVEGSRPLLRSDEDLPEELHAALDRVYYRLPAGLTIGPSAADPTTSQAQLEELAALLLEAERQGWLGESAPAVRSAVNGIRATVAAQDLGRARNQTSALLETIAAYRYPGLLSEARALIEFRIPSELR